MKIIASRPWKSHNRFHRRKSDKTWKQYFRFNRFSGNLTWSGYSQGIVPNLFIRKSYTTRPMGGIYRLFFGLLPVFGGFPAVKRWFRKFSYSNITFVTHIYANIICHVPWSDPRAGSESSSAEGFSAIGVVFFCAKALWLLSFDFFRAFVCLITFCPIVRSSDGIVFRRTEARSWF